MARLNRALNTTVSDSRLSITPIAGYRDAFRVTRVVDGNDVPLELDGTTLCLAVEQVVLDESGRCRVESYPYRLQTDPSPKSWLIRWDYVRDPPQSDYTYPRAHMHVNGAFPDGEPIGRVHIASRRMPLELVLRNMISDWGVSPRTGDWERILDESAQELDDSN